MSSIWNNKISITIFGESHGNGIGVVMNNIPSGEYIDKEKLLAFMSRRAPKKKFHFNPKKRKGFT